MSNIFLDFGKKSIIKYWDFNINPDENLKKQISELKEDLVQVEFYNSSLLIDIGFYPSFSKNGKFLLNLVEKDNWNNNIEKLECTNIGDLQAGIYRILNKYGLDK